MNVHFGIQLTPQSTTWPELRDTAMLIDKLGFDSLMTWDHFVPLMGEETGPNFEAWQLLAAWGAITKHVQLATLVTGNTYRHPALLAKMAATLDRITDGRAILGLGAGWHESEHQMYGIPLGSDAMRLQKLAESARLIGELLTRQRTTFNGRYYQLTDALCEPKPVQQRLPLMIGGEGERVLLRIAARYADIWHGFGPPEKIEHKLSVLRRHCAEVGRDPEEVRAFITPRPPIAGVVLRERESDVRDQWRLIAARAGMRDVPDPYPVHTVDKLVELLLRYWRIGVHGFIFYVHAPFDHETLRLLAGAVRPRFLQAIVSTR